jgi:cobalamin biosynthesis protein CbiD
MGDEMGEACETYSGEGTYKVLVEIPNGKKIFERTSNLREGNGVMSK